MGAPERTGGAGGAGRGDEQGPELRSRALDVRDHEGLGAGKLRDPHDLGGRHHRPQEPLDAARTGNAGRRPGAHPGGYAHPARGHARVRAPARVAAGRAAAVPDRARGQGRACAFRRDAQRPGRERCRPLGVRGGSRAPRLGAVHAALHRLGDTGHRLHRHGARHRRRARRRRTRRSPATSRA